MIKCKKTAAVFCAAMLLNVFTGCGSNGGNSSVGEIITMSEEEIESSLSYKTEHIKVPVGIRLNRNMAAGNGIYFTVDTKENKSAGVTSISLIAFDADKLIFNTVISDSSVSGNFETVKGLAVNDDNSVCILLEGDKDGKTVRAVTVSSDGNITDEKDFSSALSEKTVNSFVITPDGEYVIDNGRCAVTVFSADGSFAYEAEPKGIPDQIISTGLAVVASGDPAVSVGYIKDKEFISEVHILDRKSGKFGKAVPVEGSVFIKGNGEYSYYVNTDTGISGVREDGSSEMIINLLNLGITGSGTASFQSFEDGSFTLGIYDRLYPYHNGFIRLIPTDGAETKSKTVLTMGCFEIPAWYDVAIADFNAENDDYVIVVNSFTENLDADRTAALIDFNNQMITGNIPDIVITNEEMPFDGYCRKGLFTDLYPYLDNDSELSRDSFFENTLKACENDGKLYGMIPTFGIETFVAKGSIVGDNKLLTMEKAKELTSKMGDDAALTIEVSRSDALKNAMRYSDFIDYENGMSRFDSDEFRALLTELKKFPETPAEYDSSSQEYFDSQLSYRNGKTLIMPFRAWDFLYMYRAKLFFDEDRAYVNFPTVSPKTNAVIKASSSRIAVSEKSENKDGAWEFIRYLMTHNLITEQYSYINTEGEEIMVDDYSYYSLSGFPANKAEYEKLAENALKPLRDYDENGVMKPHKYSDYFAGDNYELDAFTEDEVKAVTDMVSTASADNLNSQIMTIISEEAEAFFHDDTDVETASKNIQSRMNIYMSENYS